MESIGWSLGLTSAGTKLVVSGGTGVPDVRVGGSKSALLGVVVLECALVVTGVVGLVG